MSSLKKTPKTDFIPGNLDDIVNASQFLNNSPKGKQKRRLHITNKNIPNLSTLDPPNAKKRKTNEDFEDCGESRQKILHVMNRQLQSRHAMNENLLKSLSEVVNHLEVDYNILKENEQKLEQLTSSFLKCIQQATAAHKQKLRAVQEIHTTFQKAFAEMEKFQRSEVDMLGEEVEEDIKKLKQNLISETKRSGWESLRRSFIRAMQNDF